MIAGDELRDIKLGDDREVFVDAEGDLATTSGIETVEQSVAIEAGQVLRPLVGEPLTGQTYADIQQELEDILQRDPQIESVDRVEVGSVNRAEGIVNVTVFTQYNNSFDIEVTV